MDAINQSICLNPLGIGEGFERRARLHRTVRWKRLNPLGIGEGFERLYKICRGNLYVLIP